MELTLRYTTPAIHCRHRKHKCDGGISFHTGAVSEAGEDLLGEGETEERVQVAVERSTGAVAVTRTGNRLTVTALRVILTV